MESVTWRRLFLILAALLVFGRALGFGFIAVSDDDINIFSHHHDLIRTWTEAYEKFYIPLPYTLWTLLWKTVGYQPFYYHALNLALHLVSVLLVYELVHEFYPYTAFWAALAWAVHPLMVEPVVWVTGLRDLLSGTLTLACLLAHMRGKKISPLFAVLAVLAKPGAAVLPLLAFILRPSWRVIWLVPACCLAVGVGVSGQVGPSHTVLERLWSALDTVGAYPLAKPSADQWHLLPSVNLWEQLFPLAGALILVGAAAKGWWRLGLRFYLAALLPTLGLVSFTYQEWSNIADRYAYIPFLGLAFVVAAWLERAQWRGTVVFVVCLFQLATAAQAYTERWRDAFTLHFSEIRQCDPQAFGRKPHPPVPIDADCIYYPKPNSCMILGINERRHGNETAAALYFDEAKAAYDWRQWAVKEGGIKPFAAYSLMSKRFVPVTH